MVNQSLIIMPVGKVTAKQFLSSTRTKDELTGLPLGLIGSLDQVLRSAGRLIGHVPKYASVSAYMRDVLCWLPVFQRILYRVSALFWRFATSCAPSYLTDLFRPVSDLASRRALRSPACGELLVPQARSALNSVEHSLLLAL